jgi:hypothetical protein
MNKVFIFLIITTHWFGGSWQEKFEWGPCLLQYLEPCTSNTIQFYLFTSDRPNDAPILLDNISPIVPKSIDLSNYNIKLIVHGYGGNLDYNATRLIRNGK